MGSVSLRIYDASDRLVRTLIDGLLPAGEHSASWDGQREEGGAAGVGVYMCMLRSGDSGQSAKLFHYR